MIVHVPLPKAPPDWQPYAAAVIARLQAAPPKPRPPADFDGEFDGSFDAPKPHPAPSMAAQLEAILASDASPAEGAGLAEVPAPPPLDVEQLMLVLQLAGVKQRAKVTS